MGRKVESNGCDCKADTKQQEHCTNLANPHELKESYSLNAEGSTHENNHDNSKTESSNEIELSSANLLALKKRVEALESHHKACSVDIADVTETSDTLTQPAAPHKSLFNRQVLVCIGAIALLIIFIGILLFSEGSKERKFFVKKVPRSNASLVIGKNEWFGEPEQDKLEKLQLPIKRIIIAHVGNKCENRIQCDARVQSIQAFHIHSNGWIDIGYNFLVGGDGLVYEGRGWYKQGAHTLGYNKDSICIAFIGTYNVEVPTANNLKAAQLLIDEGVRLGVLTGDYRLYGARQLSATESPGKALYNIIMQWPHWSRNIGINVGD